MLVIGLFCLIVLCCVANWIFGDCGLDILVRFGLRLLCAVIIGDLSLCGICC